ncbi:MAG: hypothetical protein IJ775_04365 [Muribaculaceae bacterium]|nr:hypothetical protein [Muribaculaceae bacterium]
MTLRLSHIILSIIAMTVALMACSDSHDIDRAYTDYRYDIVTYMGNDDAGHEVYRLDGRDDNPAVTLLATGTHAPQDSHLGRRVLLRYEMADAVSDSVRHITAYAASAIISDSMRYTLKPVAQYLQNNSPVKLRSVWRTGDYLNLHGQLEYTGKSRHFYLLLDSATWHRDTVHCYLVHNVFGDTTRHWREFYASFYIGTLWKRNPKQVLRFHADDLVRPEVTYRDFTKSN